MRLAQDGLTDICLIDIARGLACGKAFDLEDARPILRYHYNIQGTDDIEAIKDSGIVIITAGLTRKSGMSREDLLNTNAAILKDICLNIKKLAPKSILIVVTNPVDILTYFTLKLTGFKSRKVLGMGISLDAARFANLISRQLNIPAVEIEACVIGPHTEEMLPLPRFTHIKGIVLEEFLSDEEIKTLVKKTIDRGKEIISLLGNGSAYFAPSAAIAAIVKIIAKDEKRTQGVCAYLNGEYGMKDVCIGVPCRLGKDGIEEIIELDLNANEKELFLKSATYLKEQSHNLIVS